MLYCRWQRDAAGSQILNTDSGLPVLEFVCIERGDGGGWAIPGGMVDPGINMQPLAIREVMEVAGLFLGVWLIQV